MDPAPAATGPAKTREIACEGYRRGLAAHQEATPPRRVDSGIAQAVQRQDTVLHELSRCTFPETDASAPGDEPTQFDAARSERRGQAEVSRAAALRRARAERAQRNGAAITLPQAAPLRPTA